MILYEMLVGVTPFNSCTVEDLFEEITNGMHSHPPTPSTSIDPLPSENLQIEWPIEEDEDITEEAKDIVAQLLCHDAMERLGSSAMGGVTRVKSHVFFDDLDWTNMLRQKAEFIPHLQGEEDTSYFDSRSDRYSHEFVSDEEDGDYETLEQPFENFTTTTPRMSSYLGESLRLQLEEAIESSSGSSSGGDLNRENRDSGIVEPASILEPTPVMSILGQEDEEEEEKIVHGILR